jgi:hypothetical protein
MQYVRIPLQFKYVPSLSYACEGHRVTEGFPRHDGVFENFSRALH